MHSSGSPQCGGALGTTSKAGHSGIDAGKSRLRKGELWLFASKDLVLGNWRFGLCLIILAFGNRNVRSCCKKLPRGRCPRRLGSAELRQNSRSMRPEASRRVSFRKLAATRGRKFGTELRNRVAAGVPLSEAEISLPGRGFAFMESRFAEPSLPGGFHQRKLSLPEFRPLEFSRF